MIIDFRLLEILQGKRVALVGGAQPDFCAGDYLQADLVVHVNNHWLRHRGRIEALYHNCNRDVPIEELDAEGFPWDALQFVIGNRTQCGHRKLAKRLEEIGVLYIDPSHDEFGGPNPFGPEHEWLNDFRKRLQCHPLMGVIAAYHLLIYPIDRLFLTGFTFYHERGRGAGFPAQINAHQIMPQVNWLRSVMVEDNRVRLDAILEEIMDQ